MVNNWAEGCRNNYVISLQFGALKGRKGKWNIFIKKINQSSKPQKVILHEYSQQHIILCIEQQLSSFMSITKSHAYENKKQKNQ